MTVILPKCNISIFSGFQKSESEISARFEHICLNYLPETKREGLLFTMMCIHGFTFRAIRLFSFSQYLFLLFLYTCSVWQQIEVSDPVDYWNALSIEYIMVPGGRGWIDRLKLLKK